MRYRVFLKPSEYVQEQRHAPNRWQERMGQDHLPLVPYWMGMGRTGRPRISRVLHLRTVQSAKEPEVSLSRSPMRIRDVVLTSPYLPGPKKSWPKAYRKAWESCFIRLEMQYRKAMWRGIQRTLGSHKLT